MRISLDELIHQQHNIGCWFDRETYTFLHRDLPPEDQWPYQRYIPMFRVDWEAISFEFMLDMNDENEYFLWECSGLSPAAFQARETLERRWLEYYDGERKKLAIAWCRENNIRYEGEEEFENQ